MSVSLRYVGTAARVKVGDFRFERGGDFQDVPNELAESLVRAPGSEDEWEAAGGSSVEPADEPVHDDETDDGEEPAPFSPFDSAS